MWWVHPNPGSNGRPNSRAINRTVRNAHAGANHCADGRADSVTNGGTNSRSDGVTVSNPNCDPHGRANGVADGGPDAWLLLWCARRALVCHGRLRTGCEQVQLPGNMQHVLWML